jgi:hypothetical protein
MFLALLAASVTLNILQAAFLKKKIKNYSVYKTGYEKLPRAVRRILS